MEKMVKIGSNRVTIGIAGAGGDGVVVLGSFFQKIAASCGYYSAMPRYYGAQIRGGGSAVKLSLDAERFSIPKDTLDILVCFNWDKYLEFTTELQQSQDTIVIYEYDPPQGIKLPAASFKIDFSTKSEETTESPKNKNLVALGLLAKIVGLPEKYIKQTIKDNHALGLLKDKMTAFEEGERLFTELSIPELSLPVPVSDVSKIILHGSAAMARAAIRAGCKSFFGYPITPAAEIMQEMQEKLPQQEGTFVQAEDEIASAGMVVGASLSGVKAMTSTSGPGLDLMTEMMGLAASAEIPMLIVDVQRCGPSTGIPSKSEQSDLNHAVYGGHGDAPRVVMAPYDLEGCYRLIIEGFNIAYGFQTVVIMLSDQWLGQTMVAVDDTFLHEKYQIVETVKPDSTAQEQYCRYQLGEDFISPMAAAGDEGLTYQATGLTHNTCGAPAFDFETQQMMHEKRWQKLMPLCQRDDLVKVFGAEESGKGIISWGSSAQVVLEVVRDLDLLEQVKVCIPELLYPLPDKLARFVASTEMLLIIEMNFSGQIHRLLRSNIDLPEKTVVYNRTGGHPFSKQELVASIRGLIQ